MATRARVLASLPLFHRRVLSELPKVTPNGDGKIRSFSRIPALLPTTTMSKEFAKNTRFRQQISLANLLQRYGFPASLMHDFLEKNPFLLDANHSDVERCIGVLLSFGLSQKSLVSILSSCPRVLELGFLRKWQLGFSELGFSTPLPPSVIQRVLEQSRGFRIEPDGLRRNLQVLRNAGLRDRTVIRVIEELPAVQFNSPGIDFLKGFGIQRDEIDRIIYSFPGVLAFSIENRLKPLFEEFGELGFGKDEVKKAVVEHPSIILGMEAGELSRCIELLKSLKCRLPIKEKILCEGPFRAGTRAKLRVDCLCRHGLIRREAFKVLWKEPRLILYELEDIEKKIEFLLHKLGFSIDYLVEVPEYLGVNLQKQVVPRYNVVKYLRSKGGLGFDVDLRQLINPSRQKFYNMFVKPYPECEKIFGGALRDVEAKSRNPTGLWKLFKPPTYPESKEDVRNMKLFMESLI